MSSVVSRLINIEEDLLGCKHNKHIFFKQRNVQECVSLPFLNTHVSSISKLSEGLASYRSYAPKVPTTTTIVSTPELTAEIRRVIPLSPYSKWKSYRQQADWGVSTLNRENIPQNRNSKQCSNANCKKTIYKYFLSCKMLLSNKYLYKQKTSKHMTSFVKGVILLTEKLMFPNWWLLSNTICHLLSWTSV